MTTRLVLAGPVTYCNGESFAGLNFRGIHIIWIFVVPAYF